MSQYLFVYRAPAAYDPTPDTAALWHAWFESLEEHLVDVGNPVFDRTTAGDAIVDTILGGYSLIEADTLDAAATLAEGCPLVLAGGGVEVGELTLRFAGSLNAPVTDAAKAAGA